jgi:hypothetical protein
MEIIRREEAEEYKPAVTYSQEKRNLSQDGNVLFAVLFLVRRRHGGWQSCHNVAKVMSTGERSHFRNLHVHLAIPIRFIFARLGRVALHGTIPSDVSDGEMTERAWLKSSPERGRFLVSLPGPTFLFCWNEQWAW